MMYIHYRFSPDKWCTITNAFFYFPLLFPKNSLQVDFLSTLTRFPCSTRGSLYTSLLWTLCSLLDFSLAGPSAAGGWSYIYNDIGRVLNKHIQMFRAKNRPRLMASPCQLMYIMCVRMFDCVSSLWVSVHWRLFWRNRWAAPQWPPPQGRATRGWEPSGDISPLVLCGWLHWVHYSPTERDSL